MTETESVIMESLTKRIQSLESENQYLAKALEESRAAAVGPMLGQLRLRGAILLLLGDDADMLRNYLGSTHGSEVERDVMNSLFSLANAPLAEPHRAAVRAAANGGMNRW